MQRTSRLTRVIIVIVIGHHQDPSHIALEVAMQTHPNVVLLAEDVRAKRWSLHDIVREVADAVQARAEIDKQFGTVLVSTSKCTVMLYIAPNMQRNH